MSNVRQAFQNGKVFIPSITCGDSDLESTKRNVRAVVVTGTDLAELGIPFFDPTAEGPVTQAVNLRALSGGVTTDAVFRVMAELREELTTPPAFTIYANVVFSYGIARFAARAAEAGIDGIVLPDVPLEEKEEFAPTFRAVGIDSISMIVPTSMVRIREIAAAAEGFLYVVPSLGVTGVRQEINIDLSSMFASARQANPSLPAAIGFGISTPAQAKHMAAVAYGVIVGSAIVRIMAEEGCEADEEIARYAREMKTVASTFQRALDVLKRDHANKIRKQVPKVSENSK